MKEEGKGKKEEGWVRMPTAVFGLTARSEGRFGYDGAEHM
jgi:hypothetical protein